MEVFHIYRGTRGFVSFYNWALRYRYMITETALKRARILAFWEKHGLQTTMEAFSVKKRTLYDWKRRFVLGGKKPEALNDKKKTPHTKRKRLWPEEVVSEITRQRWEHPNLGKDKLHCILQRFCAAHNIKCPKPQTIGRIIKDLGGLRLYPQRISHFGKSKPITRRKVLRKPKDLKATYPGHVVALDTIEKIIYGSRRYIITFEDIYTRFGFAWSTTSHASLAAKEFFDLCLKIFPFPITFVLTDNGSEFAKHFTEELKKLHLIHYHTYPKTPKMNAHCERFNRTIQDEFVDYHTNDLLTPAIFNRKLIDWLIWYNTERPHYAFQNKLSPVEFMMTLKPLPALTGASECKDWWTYTEPFLH